MDYPMRNTRSLVIPNVEIEIELQKHSLYVNLSKLICLSRKPNRLRLAALQMNPRTGLPARASDMDVPLCFSGSPEWKGVSAVNLSPFQLFISISLLTHTHTLRNDKLRYDRNDRQRLAATLIIVRKGQSASITKALITSRISLTTRMSPRMPAAPIGPPESIPMRNVVMLG